MLRSLHCYEYVTVVRGTEALDATVSSFSCKLYRVEVRAGTI